MISHISPPPPPVRRTPSQTSSKSQLEPGFPVFHTCPTGNVEFLFFFFARADFIHTDAAPARQCLGDKCLGPSVCFINLPQLHKQDKQTTARERGGKKGETKEQRVLNFKQTRRPPYQVWTASVCVSVCVCVMAELMALHSKCLQWDSLAMKGGMQDGEKGLFVASGLIA